MKSKIKWVKNSKIKSYPKICSSNVVDKESDAKATDVVVSMTNVTQKFPTINVKFSRNREEKEWKEKNTAGKWITKSWTDSHNTIASINTEEGYIHLNRPKLKSSELKELVEIVNTIS
jgi:hypothetical protein|tara:strand:+ start:279 stop:632 length:354 start_codon:yes stop_codon:yes gene_type:complete